MANQLMQIIQKDSQNINVWCDEESHHCGRGRGMGSRKLQEAVIPALTLWNSMLSNNFLIMHSWSRMTHHHILVALSVILKMNTA